ncbi:TOM1-like protein 9 isoform X1 [Eucalyptus grandis]|uniref:TOM1-like protein 9 isoform X1 n=2 Tax=Eucalyptus grandis TaxID=71139 RepID=UPI0008A0A703|nr:TOM1-like protein 9 isoform X1 [Eucalyptus grandis]
MKVSGQLSYKKWDFLQINIKCRYGVQLNLIQKRTFSVERTTALLKAETSLALVPVGHPQSTASQSQQNALVLFNVFSDSNSKPNTINTQSGYPTTQSNPSTPQFQQQQNLQAPQLGVYANGNMPNMGSNEHDQSPYSQSSVPVWNGHIAQQQQPPSPVYRAQTSDSLPPPPWEAQSVENSQVMGSQYPQPMQGSQVVVLHAQPALSGLHLQAAYPMGNEQAMGVYLQPVAGGHMPLLNSQVVPINQMVGLTTSAHPRRSLYGDGSSANASRSDGLFISPANVWQPGGSLRLWPTRCSVP